MRKVIAGAVEPRKKSGLRMWKDRSRMLMHSATESPLGRLWLRIRVVSPEAWRGLEILAGICVLAWFAVLTRPAEAVTVAWWPASGLALGLGLRTPKRYLWLVCTAVGVVLLGVHFAVSHSWPIAIAASVGAGLEMAIGTSILRFRRSDGSSLQTHADLAVLLVAVVAAAVAFGLTIASATLATGDVDAAVAQLLGAAPRRAAGMLSVVPLFMRLPTLAQHPRRAVTGAHIAGGLVMAGLVFGMNSSLPLAFLAIVPPVWAALMLAPRLVVWQMLGMSVIASYASANGRGPFAFTAYGTNLGSTVLQVFEVTMVTIVLVAALAVSRQRAVAVQLNASETLYRRNFETSLAAMLVVVNTGPSWRVRSYNRAATALLPQLEGGAWELAHLLGLHAAAAIITATELDSNKAAALQLRLSDGRHMQVGLAPLDLHSNPGTFAIQMLDITDSVHAKQREDDEHERAQTVQRALTPAALPSRPGWEHGGAAVTARQVGGDFYDLRIAGRHAVMTLGDVMGKGIGAGMLAAATRTALRSANEASRPADVLADSIRMIGEELGRSNAFVTIGYAAIDLLTGRVQLVDAGHGLSFILRDDGKVERLATFDLPLGLDTSWSELNDCLEPGDALLMVSDGVLERCGESVSQLMDVIAELGAVRPAKSPQELADALCVLGSDAAQDDATAVIMQRQPGDARTLR